MPVSFSAQLITLRDGRSASELLPAPGVGRVPEPGSDSDQSSSAANQIELQTATSPVVLIDFSLASRPAEGQIPPARQVPGNCAYPGMDDARRRVSRRAVGWITLCSYPCSQTHGDTGLSSRGQRLPNREEKKIRVGAPRKRLTRGTITGQLPELSWTACCAALTRAVAVVVSTRARRSSERG